MYRIRWRGPTVLPIKKIKGLQMLSEAGWLYCSKNWVSRSRVESFCKSPDGGITANVLTKGAKDQLYPSASFREGGAQISG